MPSFSRLSFLGQWFPQRKQAGPLAAARRAGRPQTVAIAVSACLLLILSGPLSAADEPWVKDFPPRAHSAWVYDIERHPGKERRNDPGFFAKALNDYNRQAEEGHKIRMVYVFSGSLEMYCKHGGCDKSNLVVSFSRRDKQRPRKGEPPEFANVHAYVEEMNADAAGGPPLVVAVLDGVVNADYQGSMKGFNELPRELAEAFADKVSRSICREPAIAGVQFDIEPFDVSSKNGQYYFYRRIAENFSIEVPAGDGEPAVSCRDDNHPEGRFFSIFGSSRHLKPDSPGADNLQSILRYRLNGYFVVALYDLSDDPGGHLAPVSDYSRRAVMHASRARQWASELGVMYQFGVPAVATLHEFAECQGPKCRDEYNTEARTQLAYLQAAIHAIDSSGARKDRLFIGNAVWAWSRGIIREGAHYLPWVPTEETQLYMARQL